MLIYDAKQRIDYLEIINYVKKLDYNLSYVTMTDNDKQTSNQNLAGKNSVL